MVTQSKPRFCHVFISLSPTVPPFTAYNLICDYSSEQNFLARMKMVSFQGVFPVGDGTLSLNGKRERI
ncbi:hypothetical protein ACB092_08G103100 [Castanea dentata]